MTAIKCFKCLDQGELLRIVQTPYFPYGKPMFSAPCDCGARIREPEISITYTDAEGEDFTVYSSDPLADKECPKCLGVGMTAKKI